jgi:two-component system sensor histidine kinase KdpD
VPENLPLVRLDFCLIEQALCNLLINAVQHSPAGSPVELAAQLDAGTLELCVRDHGTGLTPGDEKKIFEKFYRGTGSTTGGTGLGLSIVAGIARAHRGEVSAANNPTGGATFTIRLPVETNEKRLDH